MARALAEVMQNRKGFQIVYFDKEGRHNLPEVIRVVKQKLKSREELRSLKVVIFTAEGEGPLAAYNALNHYEPKIIAVTFPLSYSVKFKDGSQITPRVSERLRKFFDGVGIQVIIPPTLPFDSVEHMEAHSHQMKLVTDVITIFGGGFSLAVQAVLRACDVGAVEVGERVIVITGDCAALVTASTTAKFLTKQGIAINEIFCKARNFTIARPLPAPKKKDDLVIEQTLEAKEHTTETLPPSVEPQALPEKKE